MHEMLCVLLGLITGGTMAVSISGVWVVLHLPARLAGRFRAGGVRQLTVAMMAGLILAGVSLTEGALMLPVWAGAAGMVGGGIFVGMLACALGEILEAVPILAHRFHLGHVSTGFRWAMLLGKGLGAVLAALMFTL